MFVEILNLSFIGHLGDTNLVAAVGLGNMYFNTFGLAVYLGLNQTLLTLSSQAYGQGNLVLCGVYQNRARIVCTLAFIPITVIMFFSKEVFKLIGQDEIVSSYAY